MFKELHKVTRWKAQLQMWDTRCGIHEAILTTIHRYIATYANIEELHYTPYFQMTNFTEISTKQMYVYDAHDASFYILWSSDRYSTLA